MNLLSQTQTIIKLFTSNYKKYREFSTQDRRKETSKEFYRLSRSTLKEKFGKKYFKVLLSLNINQIT